MADGGRRTFVLSAMALGWLWMGARALAQQRDLARQSGLPMLSEAEFNRSFEDLAEPTRARRLNQLANDATAYVRAHFYVPPEAGPMVDALRQKMTVRMASALRRAGERGWVVQLNVLLSRCLPATCAEKCDLELRVDRSRYRFSVPRPPLPPRRASGALALGHTDARAAAAALARPSPSLWLSVKTSGAASVARRRPEPRLELLHPRASVFRIHQLLTQRGELPEQSCRWQLLQWASNGAHAGKVIAFTRPSILLRPQTVPATIREEWKSGGAAGHRTRVRSAYCARVYRHSSLRNGMNIGANRLRGKNYRQEAESAVIARFLRERIPSGVIPLRSGEPETRSG